MVSKGTNNEELLQLAIRAAKRKDYTNARVMLTQIYNDDKRNETAMLWLAKVAQSREERIDWLERVIEANPDNRSAQAGLEKLKYKQASDENRTLLLFGGVAVLMILLVVAILFVVISG